MELHSVAFSLKSRVSPTIKPPVFCPSEEPVCFYSSVIIDLSELCRVLKDRAIRSIEVTQDGSGRSQDGSSEQRW
jgi:hypothetical protein